MNKKYDIQIENKKYGFYQFNKPTMFVKQDDKRYKSMLNFKKQHGFSPDECWSLNTSICIFVLPRLIFFRKKVKEVGCYPGCFNNVGEWLSILDKIIFSFKMIKEDWFFSECSQVKKYKRQYKDKWQEQMGKDIEEGMKLFAEYFGALWW